MNSVNELPIGIFDSGIGGLTVAREVHRRLPGEDIVYLGDTARVPYGVKSPSTIQRYALESSLFLINRPVKLIVAACNTVSAVALPRLKELLRVPLIGMVEPGVKAALRASHRRRIGIIGTPSTISSKAYQNAILKLAPNAEISAKACPLLVPLAEEGRLTGEVVAKVIGGYLTGMLRRDIDTLILGCTHYPLFKPAIHAAAGETVVLVDSAETAAMEVEEALLREGLLRTHGVGRVQVFVTDVPRRINRMVKLFFGNSVQSIKRCSLGVG